MPLSLPLGSRFVPFESWASSRSSTTGSSSGEDGSERGADGGAAEVQWEESKEESGSKTCLETDGKAAAPVATTKCCGRWRTRRELAVLVAGVVLGIGAVSLCVSLAAYSILMRAIEPPVLSVEQCALVDISFAGSGVNAVIQIEGSVQSRCRYPVLIHTPDIAVYYPTIDSGVRIGRVQFPSLGLGPRGRESRAANSSFYDVNHAGDGLGPGKQGLGTCVRACVRACVQL
jgi:hypothetical protein